MKSILTILLSIFLATSSISQEYNAGTKVEINYNFVWYKGSVIEVKGDQYKIHYDGYGDSSDEWVKKDRLRLPAATTNNTSTPSKNTSIANNNPITTPVNASSYKDTNGKLYFRTFMWTGMYGSSLDISWIHLGNMGSIVVNPENGTNPVNYAAELRTNASNLGKYKIENNKLVITWNNGKKDQWSLETKGGEITAINSGIATRPQPMPANYRISGQYAGGAVLPNVSSIRTFVFTKDGTFTLNRSGAINTADVSSLSQDTNGGTYSISGNTLRLNFDNGQKEVANILIWNMGEGKKYLVINGTSFPQEK